MSYQPIQRESILEILKEKKTLPIWNVTNKHTYPYLTINLENSTIYSTGLKKSFYIKLDYKKTRGDTVVFTCTIDQFPIEIKLFPDPTGNFLAIGEFYFGVLSSQNIRI